MNVNDFEWRQENEWLETVLEEVRKQLGEKNSLMERFKSDAVETQKELWSEIGSVSISNGLDQLVDFFGYIDVMKRQKRSHTITERLQKKYERMLLSPYFGRIDFHENEEEQAERYYIGISNLMDKEYNLLVYDWRAPVCGMFYDYEIGNAGYICPEGNINGKLTLKRQYKIINTKLEYMFDSNLKIDDEILQDILGKSTDSKMKTIVTSIQKEQNKVIRNEEYKNLIVQGPAGSGKTSVALHRIAYLLYKYRDRITPKNIIIFSPNEIFNDYISNVLPELGEENMFQTTFKEYMNTALDMDLMKEDYFDMMEYALTSRKEPGYQRRIRNIKYKSSVKFIEALKKYVAYVENLNREFTDITLGGRLIISASDLNELFYKDYVQLPLKRRLLKIRERILFLLKPYEKERIKEAYTELLNSGAYIDEVEITEKSIIFVRGEMKDIYKEIDRLTEFDLMDIYKKFFEKLELFSEGEGSQAHGEKIDEIKRYSLENLKAKRLNYEDQPPLLFLKGAFGDLPKTSEIKYVIIDEAQDYTPIQYEIIYQLFNHSSITMLGDLNQAINPYMNIGNYNNISHIFPQNNTGIINLTKSYRSTMEITEFARGLLSKRIKNEYVERNGEKPLVLGFSKEEAIRDRILSDIKIYKEKGYKSIGIITRTKKEVGDLHNFLNDKVHIKPVIRDDDEYTNDTIVIPAYLAKGLEFDVVIIYNAGGDNYCCEDERLLLYTACTRALHMLCIYYTGRNTPFITESH